MSDIPDAAVKAAIEARYDHGFEPLPYNHGRCRCGANFATAVEHLEHATRRELEAAFKHLSKAVHDTSKLQQSDFTLSPPEAIYDPPVQRWETTLSDEGGDLG